MAEVIHEHEQGSNGNGFGAIVGVLLAILVIFFLFYYFGRGFFTSANPAPQVNIPDHVNINVQQQK